jgi:hypothetical protein
MSGHLWARLLFLSGFLNYLLAAHASGLIWGDTTSLWGAAGKALLSGLRYAAARVTGRRAIGGAAA